MAEAGPSEATSATRYNHPERVAIAELRKPRRPRAVDLFCGCGGMTLGLLQAGWEVVAGVDNDPSAIVTYMTNLCRWGRVSLHFLDKSAKKALETELSRSFEAAGVKLDKEGGPIVEGGLSGSVPTVGSGFLAGHPEMPGVSHDQPAADGHHRHR